MMDPLCGSKHQHDEDNTVDNLDHTTPTPLPIWALFNMFAHVMTPTTPAPIALPSPICTPLVPFRVALSVHATPSSLLPFFSFPSSFT